VGDLARGVGVVAPVFFDGGPALNVGLKQALQEELEVELIVPESPQVATAIGAAILAAERAGAAGVPDVSRASRR
jgi:activator of 2-hydroxyglutaryl-CoA dehydratase